MSGGMNKTASGAKRPINAGAGSVLAATAKAKMESTLQPTKSAPVKDTDALRKTMPSSEPGEEKKETPTAKTAKNEKVKAFYTNLMNKK